MTELKLLNKLVWFSYYLVDFILVFHTVHE